MSIIVDPALPIVVPTTRPLEIFHRPAGERTGCGQLTHGWYPMPAGYAYSNVCTPCPACFPGEAVGAQDSRIQSPGNSGPGW